MGDEPRMHVPAPVPPPHTGADFERGDVRSWHLPGMWGNTLRQ